MPFSSLWNVSANGFTNASNRPYTVSNGAGGTDAIDAVINIRPLRPHDHVLDQSLGEMHQRDDIELNDMEQLRERCVIHEASA